MEEITSTMNKLSIAQENLESLKQAQTLHKRLQKSFSDTQEKFTQRINRDVDKVLEKLKKKLENPKEGGCDDDENNEERTV